jgi:hypothetical protein
MLSGRCRPCILVDAAGRHVGDSTPVQHQRLGRAAPGPCQQNTVPDRRDDVLWVFQTSVNVTNLSLSEMYCGTAILMLTHRLLQIGPTPPTPTRSRRIPRTWGSKFVYCPTSRPHRQLNEESSSMCKLQAGTRVSIALCCKARCNSRCKDQQHRLFAIGVSTARYIALRWHFVSRRLAPHPHEQQQRTFSAAARKQTCNGQAALQSAEACSFAASLQLLELADAD